MNPCDQSPLRDTGQGEGEFVHHIIQESRSLLVVFLFKFGIAKGQRKALPDRKSRVYIFIPGKEEPPSRNQGIHLELVLLPKMLRQISLDFPTDVFPSRCKPLGEAKVQEIGILEAFAKGPCLVKAVARQLAAVKSQGPVVLSHSSIRKQAQEQNAREDTCQKLLFHDHKPIIPGLHHVTGLGPPLPVL